MTNTPAIENPSKPKRIIGTGTLLKSFRPVALAAWTLTRHIGVTWAPIGHVDSQARLRPRGQELGARRGHWSVTSPQGFLTALRSEIQSAKLPPDPALRGWGPWRPGLGGAAWAQHPQPCSRGGALLSVPHVLPLLSEMRIDAGETESRTTRPLAVHTRSDSDTQNSGAALHVVLLVLPDSSGRWPPQPSADLRPLTRRRRSGSRPAPPFEVCGEWREGRWGPCQTSASHASLDEPPVSPPPNAGPARSGLSAGVGVVLTVTQTQAGAALVGASACVPPPLTRQ